MDDSANWKSSKARAKFERTGLESTQAPAAQSLAVIRAGGGRAAEDA